MVEDRLTTAGEDDLCVGERREAVVLVVSGLRRFRLDAATVRTRSLLTEVVTVTALPDAIPVVVVVIGDILLFGFGSGFVCG